MSVLRTISTAVALLAMASACSHIAGTSTVPATGTQRTEAAGSSGAPDPQVVDLDRVYRPQDKHVPNVTFPPASATGAAATTTSAYANAVLTNTPESYYRLGDTGSTAVDSSGNNLSATYFGVGAGLTQATPGLLPNDPEKSATWSGAGAYVSRGRDTTLESAGAVSFEIWAKLSSTGAYQSIAEYGDNSSTTFKGFGLKFDSGARAFAFKIAIPNGTVPYTFVEPAAGAAGTNLSTGVVYYVVGTYDGSTANLYLNGQRVASRALTGKITYDNPANNSGLVIGNNQSAKVPTFGSLQEVALYTQALSASSVQTHYNAGVPSATVAYTDWSTFGYDVTLKNYNPNEKTISTGNAANLHLLWSLDLGEKIDATPVLAQSVSTPSGTHNLLYIGAENGKFYAIDADTHSIVWSRQLGSYLNANCGDLGGSPFGITGSAAFDRTSNRVYVVDGQDNVYALNMADGSIVSGWPVSLGANVSQNHAYSGVVFNHNNGMLYASTASYCDNSPWQGRIAAINTAGPSLTGQFFPASTAYGGTGSGGGIWGPAAAAIDLATNDVFIVTGNGDLSSSTVNQEHTAYNEHIVRLDAMLTTVKSANYPQLPGNDVDFGATVMLFQPPGCNSMAVAKNKSGILAQWQWQPDTINSGPAARIIMAPVQSNGDFIGAAAYSPVTNLVYVSDWANAPNGTSYVQGMNALASSNCTLTFKWGTQANTGSGGNQPTSTPTIGNGVVYFGAGLGNAVYAFDALTGAKLWSSGSTITGATFAAPIVDGHLFVGSWDHKLYAFGV